MILHEKNNNMIIFSIFLIGKPPCKVGRWRLAEAKKVGYRLPFSFLQKDWKTINFDRLLAAHKKIYEIDYALKNGAAESGIFEPVFF